MRPWISVMAGLTALGAVAQETNAPAAAAVPAADVAKAETSELKLDGGLDLRFRYDWADNLPNSGGKMNGKTYDYYRLRSRVWGSASYGNLGVYTRLADEFRGYHNNASKNEFPDQLFVDNLYVDVNKLFDERVDLRIGRQDMLYGAGRVIADGTASDGSRSAYFDAVKMTTRVTDKTSFDVFGMYQRDIDQALTVGQPEYYLTSYGGQDYDEQLREWAVGSYWTVNEWERMPMEFYLVFKDESSWYKKGKTADRVPGRSYTTVGARLMPKLTDKLSAELEGACQFGETDDDGTAGDQPINAFMGYGGLTYKEKDWSMKPYLTGACLYMSGDESDSAYDTKGGATDDVTGWNPVFGRYTYLGELPVKMYGSSYRWSNLIWPHAEIGFEPFKKQKAKLQTGPMYADEDDVAGSGSLYRGYYTTASYEFPLLKAIYGKRGEVKGKLSAEYFAPGGYYDAGDSDQGGYFLRAEVSMKF